MRRQPRKVHAFSVLVAAVTVSAFGGLGVFAGRTTRTSAAQAAATARASAASSAYPQAEASAYAAGWRRSYHRGWVAGAAAGRVKGTRAGRAAATAEAARRAVAAQAASLAAALASTPVALTKSTKTDQCVPVGGGLCEVLGPGATGRPCPPGSVPNTAGGVVCVPQVLILAARVAGAPGVNALVQ